MINNLKLVLHQHKKFLAIFFIVVFLPSVVLAFFSIRAIHNERYKLQQQILEQQKRAVRTIQAGIHDHIENNSSKLKALSADEVFSEWDYSGIHDLISEALKNKSLLGHIVIWNSSESPWIPGFQAYPPGSKTLTVPDEWKRWSPDLASAENAEFLHRNFQGAVSQYRKILSKTANDQVKAWLLSRIARCESKREDFKQAVATYKSIITHFPDLSTESGRPLELTSRLEMLDAFQADGDHASFFRESLVIYDLLEQNIWSLDGEQIKVYAGILKNMIDEVMVEGSSNDISDDYAKSVSEIQNAIAQQREIWEIADAVRQHILPLARENSKDSGRGSFPVQKNAFEYEGRDILLFLTSLDQKEKDSSRVFMGSLVQIDDLLETIEIPIKENCPPGCSLLIHSNLTGSIVFGEAGASRESAVATDFFPGNFPPWRLELFKHDKGESSFSLYKNIFFWTVLALLVIVFFGSGLIIRTLVQELNLLNLKSAFIASVSHEFKTPLTAMGAVLERLLSGEVKESKKIEEYYKILSHDSERLKRLVKNVLDFTKIEDGKRDYRFAAMDIIRLVRHEVDNFHDENKMSGLKVETKIDAAVPSVFADEEAMSQALHNVLDNAAKFSGSDKNIEVKVIRQQDKVQIAVQDRGVGIPENEQKKVFEKFYRGKQSSSVSPTGTGLGLTLVKHIMEAHSGDIVIKSQPGKGTCVSLILPLGKGG